MFDSFFDSICRVGIFVMCAQTIVHFKPKEVYEKYLRYLVSVMVLIQLFLPLGSFLLGGGSAEINRALKQFETELQKRMEQAEERAVEADKKLESMTLEEVRKQMEEAAEGESDALKEGETVPGEENASDVYDNNDKIEVETVEPIVIGD